MPDLQLHVQLSAEPTIVYDTWLHPVQHGVITEAFASIDGREEGQYQLWGGVVQGRFTYLERPKSIVQTWKTSEFSSSESPSQLTLGFKSHHFGTRLLITHEKIPKRMYEQFRYGWENFYFPRLEFYFANLKK